jgi:hypothetical protein
MENTTQSNLINLDLMVQRWRENLAASPAFRGGDLDELESHLRDAVADLHGRGLSVEEAFLVATRRMGGGGSLEAEFAKGNRPAVWLDRVLWMLIGVQAWGFVVGILSVSTRGLLFLGLSGSGYDYAAHGPVVPVALAVLMQLVGLGASMAVCWWLMVCKGQSSGKWIEPLFQHRATLVLAGGVLFVVLLVAPALSAGLPMLLATLTGPRAMGEVYRALAYSNVIIQPIQVAVILAITLFLVRARLRMRRA